MSRVFVWMYNWKIFSFRFIVKMYNLKIFSFPLNKVHFTEDEQL